MPNDKITEYKGNKAGDKVRDMWTGNAGIIVEFELVPDGVIVIFQDETGKTYGQYLHNTEYA